MLYKRYVPVIVMISKEGNIKPLSLIWEDINGRVSYPIDKITRTRKAASQAGGCGILYECIISGQKRNLFYEKNRWFVECKRPY